MSYKFLRPPISQMANRSETFSDQVSRDMTSLIIPISAIKQTKNIRSKIEDIESLAVNIKATQLLNPITVRKIPDGYELIAGARRLEAMKLLGHTSIPARVIDSDTTQMALLKAVENLQRENLNALEEVMTVADLVKVYDGKQATLAELLGRPKAYISKCIKAAQFLQENPKVSDQKLSREMLFALAYSDDQKKAAAKVADGSTTSSKAVGKDDDHGKFVRNSLKFKQKGDMEEFSLMVNYSKQYTPLDAQAAIVEQLKDILNALNGKDS